MQVEIHLEDERGDILRLIGDYADAWNNKEILIPAGFESDGVSTPRFLWTTISPAIDQRTLRAGVCHDWIYREQPDGWTRADADNMFYDFCRQDGLGWLSAQKAYWGLRAFGWIAWNNNKKRGEKGANDK